MEYGCTHVSIPVHDGIHRRRVPRTHADPSLFRCARRAGASIDDAGLQSHLSRGRVRAERDNQWHGWQQHPGRILPLLERVSGYAGENAGYVCVAPGHLGRLVGAGLASRTAADVVSRLS